MNDIYAIDPGAPQDLRDLKLMAELFGFEIKRKKEKDSNFLVF